MAVVWQYSPTDVGAAPPERNVSGAAVDEGVSMTIDEDPKRVSRPRSIGNRNVCS
jgi:hypothetical protein